MRRFFSTLGAAAVVTSLLLPAIAQPDRRRSTTFAQAANGRLVVACDMRSDTCSDGRKITTTRSTPVPCETSPGVWEIVPEDTSCISWRGLEVWAENTSYLVYGAELDRSPWGSVRGGTLEGVSDGWLVSNDPSQSNSGWVYTGGAADEGVTYTVACRVRADTPTTLRVSPLNAGGSNCPLHQVGTEWQTVACTQTADAGRSERAHIWPGVGQEGPASVIVAGCWLTKTSTPGRACWGGEAPVTCAADQHTISTEGWPTEGGEISVVFEVGALEGSARYIIDGRAVGATTHSVLLINNSGRLRFDLVAGTPNLGPAVPAGKHHVRLRWGDGQTQVFLDGAQVMDVAGTPTWHEAAYLGRRYASPFESLNGSIRSLTVRSYEEVSP